MTCIGPLRGPNKDLLPVGHSLTTRLAINQGWCTENVNTGPLTIIPRHDDASYFLAMGRPDVFW